MGIQARVGDVFLIPLGDDQGWAFGQLVDTWNDELYVAIFGKKLETAEVDLKSIPVQKPIFLTLTLDAKLWHGDWPIVGNVQKNLSSFPQPTFKVRQSGMVYIESRDRTFSRPASASEAEVLRYRSVSSPAMIENAVRARFGIGGWSPQYDEFDAAYATESSRLVGS